MQSATLNRVHSYVVLESSVLAQKKINDQLEFDIEVSGYGLIRGLRLETDDLPRRTSILPDVSLRRCTGYVNAADRNQERN